MHPRLGCPPGEGRGGEGRGGEGSQVYMYMYNYIVGSLVLLLKLCTVNN